MNDGATFVFVLNWDVDHPGGVNEVVKNLYDEFSEGALFSPLIAINDWRYRSPYIVEKNGRAEARLYMRAPVLGKPRWLDTFRFLVELPWLFYRNKRFINKHSVVVVNAHYPDLSMMQWVVMKACRVYRGSIILSLHGRDFRDAKMNEGFEKWLWVCLFRAADKIVTCAQGLGAEVVQEWPNLRDKVVCIHNGVDIERLNASLAFASSKYRDRKLGRYLVNVGTFEHKKGQDILLRAFHQIIEYLPNDIRLVLIGRTSEKLEELRAAAERFGLTERVIFLRDLPQDEVLRIVSESMAFVLSSRNEAFSIALLEAAALRKPIIATDVCGVRELIPDRSLGLVVPSEDISKLGEAILNVVEAPEAAGNRSLRLYDRVQSEFTWEKARQGYEALIQSDQNAIR